jgi:hypothetical protein
MSLQHLSPTMKRETKTNSRDAMRPLLVVLAISFIAAVATSATAQTKRSQPSDSDVSEALKASFGAAVEPVTAFNPYYLRGDFNGDGAEDIVIFVRFWGRRIGLPKGVQIPNPFRHNTKTAYPDNPATRVTFALAIIHGSRTGWKAAPVAGKFLLWGESPVLILDRHRVEAEPDARNNLIELIRKRGKRARSSLPPPRDARGDTILLGTEAADSFLYWNGKTYRWYESEGGE